MMPNPQRQKGDRFERACVDTLRKLEVAASRVPLSGSAGGDYHSDLRVEVCGALEPVECKSRKRAWLDLFNWLGAGRPLDSGPIPRYLFIKADRTDTLVVMTLAEFARLSKGIL